MKTWCYLCNNISPLYGNFHLGVARKDSITSILRRRAAGLQCATKQMEKLFGQRKDIPGAFRTWVFSKNSQVEFISPETEMVLESPAWDGSFPLKLRVSDGCLGWALFFSSGCWPTSAWTAEGEEGESHKWISRNSVYLYWWDDQWGFKVAGLAEDKANFRRILSWLGLG